MRRLWIVPPGTEISDDVIAEAVAHDCAEIANGIPPRLVDELADVELPTVYVELPPEPDEHGNEPQPPDPMTALLARLEQLETEVAAIKADPFVDDPGSPP